MIINKKKALHKGPVFLMIVFGSLEFDGRTQRMIDVLAQSGSLTLVDVMGRNAGVDADVVRDMDRVRVVLPGNAGKIWRHLRLWGAALRTAWRVKPDVVVAENFFTTLTGWMAAKITRAKLVYDAIELIIPEPTKDITRRARFWYLLERWTVKRADLVIAANEERACIMTEHYGLKRVPVAIRNIPPRCIAPDAPDNILAKYQVLKRKNDEERLILYQGYVDQERGIGRFVQALAYLPSVYRFVLIGGGPDMEALQQLAKDFERQGRFVVLGQVEHRSLASITPLMDVGIIAYPFVGLNNLYCSPNKIFEYAQAGLPVVATDQPPLRRMVETYGIGALIGERDSPQQMAEAIQQVAEKRHSYSAALERFLADHRWEDEALRLGAEFKRLFSSNGLE